MDFVLTISQVSRRSGVASSALRFYEERGLIASQRAGSGHRRYPRSVLRRIAFIVFAQRIGLTLEEIGAELAKLPADRIPTSRDWARLSGKWTKRIDQRIAELKRLSQGRAHAMHWMRMPFDRQMRACEPSRPSRTQGAGSALLAFVSRNSDQGCWDINLGANVLPLASRQVDLLGAARCGRI
jgi:MerR family transcriptional regulator, redox-sensitive transcriptional activator SoxR